MIERKMYNHTSINVYNGVQGEPLEHKINRIVNNKEPIKDGAPLIYTERKEGIRASTNIRTDRWEIAIDGTDKIAKSYQARRENQGLKPENPEGSQQPVKE